MQKKFLNCVVGLITVAPSVFFLSVFALEFAVFCVQFGSSSSVVLVRTCGTGGGGARAGEIFLLLHDVVEAAAGVVLVAWQESSRS